MNIKQMNDEHPGLREILEAFETLHKTPSCFIDTYNGPAEAFTVKFNEQIAKGTAYDEALQKLIEFFKYYAKFVNEQTTDSCESIRRRVEERANGGNK